MQRKVSENELSQHSTANTNHVVTPDTAYSVDEHGPDPADGADRQSVLLGPASYVIGAFYIFYFIFLMSHYHIDSKFLFMLLPHVCFLLLSSCTVTEFCERLAYIGMQGSLVLFFQVVMGMNNEEADIQYNAWSGACYITPLLGGYIADSYLGRYNTILIFCLIYLAGMVMLVLGSIPGNSSALIIFPALYIIALGTGGIKPNVATLGADQFDERYARDRKEKESFFNWFYWSINSAALISLTVIAYICQNGIPALGGVDWGFFIGYSIPCLALAAAIVVFVSGRSGYVLKPPNGSVLSIFFSILVEALWTRRSVTVQDIRQSTSRNSGYERKSTKDVLDKACVRYGGSHKRSQVEGAKMVASITPFLLVLIPYWGIYANMSTAFQNQACQMNLDMGGSTVPISALGVFDSLAIVGLVPVFDGYIYPMLKREGYPASMLHKMGAGFVVSMIAMLLAALVEYFRRQTAPAPGDWYDASARNNITPCQSIDDYDPNVYQEWYAGINDAAQPLYCSQVSGCYDMVDLDGVPTLSLNCITCEDIPQMSSMSIFWQIPQFVAVGISEILASVTALQFFYTQAPLPMRSVCQALNLLTNALGSWLMIPLLLLVNIDRNNQWVPPNLDEGHLVWYFLLLAGLMGLSLLYFYYISCDYIYKTEAEVDIQDSDEEGEDDSLLNKNGKRDTERAVADGENEAVVANPVHHVVV